MTTVTVDSATARQLRETDSHVHLCDAEGNVLGQFVRLPYPRHLIDPYVSEEELDRAEAEGGGRPLADILRDLAAKS